MSRYGDTLEVPENGYRRANHRNVNRDRAFRSSVGGEWSLWRNGVLSASGRGLAHGKVVRGTQGVRSVRLVGQIGAFLQCRGRFPHPRTRAGFPRSQLFLRDRSDMGALCSGMKSHFEGARQPAALLPFPFKDLKSRCGGYRKSCDVQPSRFGVA